MTGKLGSAYATVAADRDYYRRELKAARAALLGEQAARLAAERERDALRRKLNALTQGKAKPCKAQIAIATY